MKHHISRHFLLQEGEHFHNGKCQQCQPGRFQSEDYNQVATCKTCARDSVSAFGAESCIDCSPDQFSNNGIDCVTCPSGYFQVDDAQISACLKCPIGKHQPARGTSFCIACNIGQYQAPEANSTVCREFLLNSTDRMTFCI